MESKAQLAFIVLTSFWALLAIVLLAMWSGSSQPASAMAALGLLAIAFGKTAACQIEIRRLSQRIRALEASATQQPAN